MSDMQYKIHAEKKQALLIVLQAMDAGGKDGTIRDVMYGFNPQGCKVKSFRAPNDVEINHDYLWRVHMVIPARGEIGILNRSHYGDVLVVRVHNLVPPKVVKMIASNKQFKSLQMREYESRSSCT